jgi:hypothetical protein
LYRDQRRVYPPGLFRQRLCIHFTATAVATHPAKGSTAFFACAERQRTGHCYLSAAWLHHLPTYELLFYEEGISISGMADVR